MGTLPGVRLTSVNASRYRVAAVCFHGGRATGKYCEKNKRGECGKKDVFHLDSFVTPIIRNGKAN